MAKTTQEERDDARHWFDDECQYDDEMPQWVYRACMDALTDADRPAQIERQVRELADELREEMDAHNRMRSFQEYEGGRIDKACSIEERLRAIIDPPDGEG